MRILKRLPSLSNVAAGSTAVLNIPIGRTIDQLKLMFSGVTLAQMKNIQLKANGKTFKKWKDGAQLAWMNAYYNKADTAGMLTFWFVENEMRTLADSRMPALGTKDLSTLTLEFDIDAAAASPVVWAAAMMSDQMPFGMTTKVLQFPNSSATAGIKEIDNLATSGARLKAIHAIKSDINSAELEINGYLAFEGKTEVQKQILKDNGRVPQAGIYHMDFVLDGDMAQAIPTTGVQDLRLRYDLASAGQIDLVVEYYDGLGGI